MSDLDFHLRNIIFSFSVLVGFFIALIALILPVSQSVSQSASQYVYCAKSDEDNNLTWDFKALSKSEKEGGYVNCHYRTTRR